MIMNLATEIQQTKVIERPREHTNNQNQFPLYSLALVNKVIYFYSLRTVYGPPDWHKLREECGGDHQSPINIDTGKVVKKDYSDLKITFDNQKGLVTGELKNTGHSPTLNIEKSQGTAEITGGPLGDTTYTLIQFHVHFGCENSRGSEHTLNRKRFAGEVTTQIGPFGIF